jgi:hypothetical protein
VAERDRPPTRLTRGFFRNAAILVRPGSATARKIGQTLTDLAANVAELPRPDDGDTLIPPVLKCHTRRVPGTAFELCYTVAAGVVTVHALRRLI